MTTIPRWAALLLVPCALMAQSTEKNPYTSATDVAEGRRLYSLFCVFCHGMDGASGRGARLASTFRRHGTSDRDEFRTIADGVPGTEMSGHFLGEEDIWKILSFVRTLERSATAASTACEAGSGDAGAGRNIFFGKGACLTCHGSGRLGPDLTYIGATRTRLHLRESLLDPSAAIAAGFRQVRVVTAAGESLRGLLLNEDEYTLHMMLPSEQIRSLYKSDLKSVQKPAESFMPSYRVSLTPKEIEDLLSYLCTLRGDQR